MLRSDGIDADWIAVITMAPLRRGFLVPRGSSHAGRASSCQEVGTWIRATSGRHSSLRGAPRPIDFLGYRIWPTHRLLRRDSVKRMRRKLKRMQYQYSRGEISLDKINASIQSWLGHAKHADTYGLRMQLLSNAVFSRCIGKS